MNYPMIRNMLGFVLAIVGIFMLPALLIALFRAEWNAALGFGITIAVMYSGANLSI